MWPYIVRLLRLDVYYSYSVRNSEDSATSAQSTPYNCPCSRLQPAQQATAHLEVEQ